MTAADAIELAKLVVPGLTALAGAWIAIDRKLTRIEGRLSAMTDRIEEHHKSLYGNGRGGLDEEVTILKERVAGIDKIQEEVAETRKASDSRIRAYVFEYLGMMGFPASRGTPTG